MLAALLLTPSVAMAFADRAAGDGLPDLGASPALPPVEDLVTGDAVAVPTAPDLPPDGPEVPADLPLVVDEAGDVMSGDLAFVKGAGVAFPGGSLTGDAALRFGSRAVCLAALQQAGCGDIEGVSAGAGLTGGGSSGTVALAADFAEVQRRVASPCAEGSSIRAISGGGAVTCEPDTDTTYTAGPGLTLEGTTFQADLAALQARIVGLCAPGFSIRAVDGAGEVQCEEDTDTTYTAGAGIAISDNGTLAADTAVVQARVAQACPEGSGIRAVAEDGSVACEVDDGRTYTAGAGLVLEGATFAVAGGGVQRGMLADAAVATAKLEGDDSEPNVMGQVRAVTAGKLADGAVVRRAIATGAVTGGTSDDASSDPTPTGAIAARTITGGNLALDSVGVLELADDAVDTAAIRDGAVTGEAGNPLSAEGATGKVALRTITGEAGGVGNLALETIGETNLADGAVTGPKIRDGTIGTADLAGLYGAGGSEVVPGAVTSAKIADGTIEPRDLAFAPATHADLDDLRLDLATDDGSPPNTGVNAVHWNVLHGVPASVLDAGDITGVTAGTGLSGGGTNGAVTVSADTSYLQRRITGSCAAGSSIRAIGSTGSVTCEADDAGGRVDADGDSSPGGTALTSSGQVETNRVTVSAPTAGVLLIHGKAFINNNDISRGYVAVPRVDGAVVSPSTWAAYFHASADGAGAGGLFTLSYTVAKAVAAGDHVVTQHVGPSGGTASFFYNANDLVVQFVPTGTVG